MTPPAVAYPVHSFDGCAGAAYQAVRGADRPICALISALAAYGAGGLMRGVLTDLPAEEIENQFIEALAEEQVDFGRALMWASAINHDDSFVVSNSFRAEFATLQGIEVSDYQWNTIGALTWAGGVLALGCGLGKTVIAVLFAIYAKGRGDRCWIFCPLNAIGTWKRWLPVLEVYFKEVRILSMDSAHKFIGAAPIGGVVIFDEAHLLGTTSRRMKSCHTIRRSFDAGLCLTGTLLHSTVENTLSVLDLAVPGAALFSTRWKAGEHFKCLVQKQLGSRKVTALEKPTTEKENFKAWLSRHTIMLEASSPEVRAEWVLPTQHLHEIRLGEPWPKLVDEVADIAMRIYDETGELPHMQEIAHILCRAGIQDKLDYLLEEVGNEPTVIFCQYRESLDHCAARLVEAKIPYVRVDGDIVGDARLEAQQRFQAGAAQVFLGQIHAAGISMDLFRARYSVALDHSWSASDYAQALARTARRGQEYETHHLDFVSNRLQARVVDRLRAARDFNAEAVEWQDGKRALAGLGIAARDGGDGIEVPAAAPGDAGPGGSQRLQLSMDVTVKGLARQAIGLPFTAEID